MNYLGSLCTHYLHLSRKTFTGEHKLPSKCFNLNIVDPKTLKLSVKIKLTWNITLIKNILQYINTTKFFLIKSHSGALIYLNYDVLALELF